MALLVYHGTSASFALAFLENGIDGHIPIQRAIHGPQDGVAGLFVTPKREVARTFGTYILEIEIQGNELVVPPALLQAGVTLEQSLSNPREPQALLPIRIEPKQIRLVEFSPSGYEFNPYSSS